MSRLMYPSSKGRGMSATGLTAGTKAWANVEITSVSASGRITPRLVFALTLTTPTERIESELRHVRAQVVCGDEVLGEGDLIAEPATWHGAHAMLDVAVSHRLLDHVTSQLGRDAGVSLTVRWKGLLRVTWHPGPNDPRMQDDPKPDTPTDLRIAHGQYIEQQVTVARSDWYSRVLQPTRQDDYLYLEIAIPRGDEAERWSKTSNLVREAETCFASGDDAGVFAKLRGAFEALPGANKRIFDALPPAKRAEVDTLAKAFVNFLQHGRHVARDGEAAGTFPVDRIDAEFALSTTKVLLSYTSRVLSSSRNAT